MHRGRTGSAGRWVVGVALAASACATNPTPRCELATDCAWWDTCYRGFCIGRVPPDGAVCGWGRTYCRECVDVDTDERHCGTCDHRCDDDEDCVGGRCGS